LTELYVLFFHPAIFSDLANFVKTFRLLILRSSHLPFISHFEVFTFIKETQCACKSYTGVGFYTDGSG
jgi:hypothetical protein